MESKKSNRFIRIEVRSKGFPESKPKILRFQKNRIVIGSVISADVRLPDDTVSPIHAVILGDLKGGKTDSLRVFDLASQLGLSINGVKQVSVLLTRDDVIQIGNYLLTAVLEEASQLPKSDEDLKPLLLVDASEVEEIFDYRSTSRLALEVVLAWKGTILDVEHFVTERKVTIGGDLGCSFGIPPLLTAARYSLADRQGTDWTLNLDTKMQGVLQQGGNLVELSQVKNKHVALGTNDFAKVSLNDLDFYLSFTDAPPRLKRRRFFAKDPFLNKTLILSLILTGAVIYTLIKFKSDQKIEAEEVPERIATILYQPEKFPVVKEKVEKTPEAVQQPSHPEPTPKLAPTKTVVEITPKNKKLDQPIPKEINVGAAKKVIAKKAETKKASPAENQAKEGAGARAKGAEGARGTRTAKQKGTPQTAAKRPSPQAGEGAGGGNSQSADHGNVDLLKGSTDQILNLLGNAGNRLGKGGSKVQGFGGFNTLGEGGAGLSGKGTGGGGTADTLLGGLSDHGRGGGKIGTGLGAQGTGSGIIGGKSKMVLRRGGSDETIVMGAIDADAIEAALLAHRDEFRLCYEREVNAGQPSLAGRVSTSFVIGGSGRVTEAGILSSSLKSPIVEKCVLDVIRRIDFPAPKGGGDRASFLSFQIYTDRKIIMENTDEIFLDEVAQWFLLKDGTPVGPSTVSEIVGRVQSGQAQWIDAVWKEGFSKWQRMCEVEEFKSFLPAAPLAALPQKKRVAAGTPPPPPSALLDSSAPAAPVESRVWFLYYNDSQFGPFSQSEVERYLHIGKLHGRVHAWKEDYSQWMRLEAIDVFRPAVEAAMRARNESKKVPPAPVTGAAPQKKELRSSPRMPLVAQILMTDQQTVITGICRDISVGGMQVLTDRIPGQVGSALRLNVCPTAAQGGVKVSPFVAEGEIVRVLEDGRGFSFRFSRLKDDAKKAIEDFILNRNTHDTD